MSDERLLTYEMVRKANELMNIVPARLRRQCDCEACQEYWQSGSDDKLKRYAQEILDFANPAPF